MPTDAKATYKATRDLHPVARREQPGYKPAGDTGNKRARVNGDIPDKTEITGETGDLTMLLILPDPPEEVRLTIKFTDDLTGTARTPSASLAGKTWLGRQVRTPTAVAVEHPHHPTVLFSKDPATDVLPYQAHGTT